MKYFTSSLSLLFKKLSILESIIEKSLFIVIVIGAITSCKKESNTTPSPIIPSVQPPADLGKIIVTTGTPIVNSNTSITFSGDVLITAPATVYTKYLIITWFNDTLHAAESETISNLSYTKTNCIPGTKYTVKAVSFGSLGTIYGDENFATTTGFHIGQTFNGFKVWDVWSNSDSAQLIGNLLANKYAWGCQGIDVPGTSNAFGSGMANSLKIKAICPASAANLCLNDTVLGIGSYLGSEGDWIRFFENRSKAGVTLFASVWSSTQDSPVYALMLRSLDGFTLVNAKMVNTSPIIAGPCVYAFKKVGR